jgi:tetratricopeptide (TPR) repeat protein
MGDVWLDARQLQSAETEYRKALSGDPDSGAAEHTKLAETLRLQGKFPEAVAELKEALHRQSNSVRAHSDLALVLRAQKNNPEAIAEYQEALRLDPDYIDAHRTRWSYTADRCETTA